MSILLDFIKFLKVRRKLFLLPLIILIFIFGGLLILSEGSAIAPFIYTLF